MKKFQDMTNWEKREYYLKACECIKDKTIDVDDIDYDRMVRIGYMGQNTVFYWDELKDRDFFNSDDEYEYYLLSVYEAVYMIKYNLI